MNRTTSRLLAAVLLVLLAANGVRLWISHRSAVSAMPGFPGGPGGPDGPPPFDDAMQERVTKALEKLPPEQRQPLQERFDAERAFFESVRNLPPAQRRLKMMAHFAQNPPPAELMLALGPPPGVTDGPGGPGGPPPGAPGADGRTPRIPEPGIRQTLDTQIINAQKNAAP